MKCRGEEKDAATHSKENKGDKNLEEEMGREGMLEASINFYYYYPHSVYQ